MIRIDRAAGDAPSPLPCDVRSQALIEQLAVFVARDAQNSVRLTNLRKGLVEKHCVGCHSDFGLKPGLSDAQKDATVLRFMLSQDGWIYPGDPDSGKLRTRLRGLGAEKLMPPGGDGLPKAEPGYTRLLDTADLLVSRMVPGIRMRIKSACRSASSWQTEQGMRRNTGCQGRRRDTKERCRQTRFQPLLPTGRCLSEWRVQRRRWLLHPAGISGACAVALFSSLRRHRPERKRNCSKACR